jgi:hypothetical protein
MATKGQTVTVKVRSRHLPAALATARPPAADLDVANLTLQGKGVSAKLKQAITDGSIEQTIQGASTLTLTVADWAGGLLRSALLAGGVTLTFDGLSFTMVKISKSDTALTLTFEETAANLLRQYSSPKKADRATTTRAQFVRSLVQEVTQARIPFRCPEVNKRQAVATK